MVTRAGCGERREEKRRGESQGEVRTPDEIRWGTIRQTSSHHYFLLRLSTLVLHFHSWALSGAFRYSTPAVISLDTIPTSLSATVHSQLVPNSTALCARSASLLISNRADGPANQSAHRAEKQVLTRLSRSFLLVLFNKSIHGSDQVDPELRSG